jgi:hypothetical protein
MTPAEIIIAVISILALIISGITAYLTLLTRFQGCIIGKYRAVLTQIEAIQCLVLECEFINDGAKPGVIEDVLVSMVDEQGNPAVFTPFLTKDQFNVFSSYQINDFTTFSGISLGAKQRREIFLVFRSNSQSAYKPEAGEILLRADLCANVARKKWRKSALKFSMELKDENIKEWISPTGKPQLITAIEVGQSRREFLHSDQR